MGNNDTCSAKHQGIGIMLQNCIDSVSKRGKVLESDLEKILKLNDIGFEKMELSNVTEYLIFTGSSGYDIVGYSISIRRGICELSEMYN